MAGRVEGADRNGGEGREVGFRAPTTIKMDQDFGGKRVAGGDSGEGLEECCLLPKGGDGDGDGD
jgi:hypothetical protein